MANRLGTDLGRDFHFIDHADAFNIERVKAINPEKIFVVHWSWFIPAEIFDAYDCVVFHMTDLPFGRGGSPLQNLIVRGLKTTKISAIRVGGELDAGPVFLKKDLSLEGSAGDILKRSVPVIESMIREIVEQDIVPEPQEGEVVVFERRKPSQSDISGISSIKVLFDHIRMLDGEGYPNAFLETNAFRLEFSGVNLQSDGSLVADVRIVEK